MEDVLAKTHRLVKEWKPVGSRVTCDPPPTDTDRDFVVLVRSPDTFRHAMQEIGFAPEGAPGFYTGNDNGRFVSYRRDDVNVIATPEPEFYELFLTATELARRFNLMLKEDRIALFQAVLYGVKYQNLKDAPCQPLL